MESSNYELSQTQSSHVAIGGDVNDGFENFFNNESLSDRTLLICETEKIEYYSGGSDFTSGTKRRSDEISDGEEERTFKRPIIKQEIIDDDFCDEMQAHTLPSREQCSSISVGAGECSSLQEIKVEEDFDEVDVAMRIPHIETDPAVAVASEKQNDVHPVAAVEQTKEDGTTDHSPALPSAEEETQNNVTSENSSLHAALKQQMEETSTNILVIESVVGEKAEEPPLSLSETAVGEEVEGSLLHVSVATPQSDCQIPCSFNVSKRTYTLETKILRETRVFVHSIILAAKSDFFKCLFSTSGMKETQQQEVKIEVGRNETETMLILLRCFYNRNFISQKSLDTVINVCSLAMKYCFDGLIDKCLEVFADRAGSIIDIDDFNRINVMINKIQSDLHQHKGKCSQVLKKCHTFLINTFKNLDECFEAMPCKLFQLRLEAMSLFLDPYVQGGLSNAHGNLFLYSMQRWLRHHQVRHNLNSEDPSTGQIKKDTFIFIEKLLTSTSLANVTSDFLTNVLNYEISPFNMWPGYKDWYIRALQNHIFQSINRNAVLKTYPVLKREREMKYIRQEKNADIFSMPPVILNGFEIGIYLRVREDRKLHLLCKCKNLIVSKVGFDKAVLSFTLKGNLKLNTNSTLWKEPFPRQFSSHPAAAMFTDRFAFSYKQNTMCLQMYSLCRLSPAVYNIAKRNGFLIDFEIQHVH